jgi:FAD synthetase
MDNTAPPPEDNRATLVQPTPQSAVADTVPLNGIPISTSTCISGESLITQPQPTPLKGTPKLPQQTSGAESQRTPTPARYRPAYELQDGNLERSGRGSAQPQPKQH